MSSTYVADTSDDQKSDNTLIIIVNNDGTISVDQETLQNLLANQHNAGVSLVRLTGHSQGDDSSQDSNGTSDSQNDGNPHVNLTVEGFYPPGAIQNTTTEVPASAESLVDPFLEMDSEQLERLETALQSEQAKQILGENVTAMLDMLSVDEEASQLKDSIRMDHCYTSLTPSSEPPPSLSNNQYSNMAGGSSDAGYEREHGKQRGTAMGMTTLQAQSSGRARGRGRGPGRPRKDASIARASTSYRGGVGRGANGRGGVRVQRGGVTGTLVPTGGTGNNIVVVQQIKHINPPLAPPPNSPSTASLVPLIKPLVLPNQTTAVQGGRPSVSTTVQKQVVTIPVSTAGTRFVALAKPIQVDQSGQQRVVVTSNPSAVQPQTIQMSSVTEKQEVDTPDGSKLAEDLGTSSLLPVVSDVGQAKVVVANMPTIPTQVLEGQSPGMTLGHTEATVHTEENESIFTDFQQESENESEDISEDDADMDEDYKDSSSRRRGRGSKNRGSRFYRGARTRGVGRTWDANRVNIRGGRRRGRGRGMTRPEDADRAKKLEAEMAAALAAMEKSPDRESLPKPSNFEKSPQLDVKKDETSCAISMEPSMQVSPKRKIIKAYGKVGGKKNLIENEEVEVEGGEATTNKKDKERTHSTSAVTDKKSPTSKSPIRKLSLDSVQSTSPNPSVSVPEARKNYPKRENRKPPAHLAEALGPALFSTPDIIRRVNTGTEQKASAPPSEAPLEEAKKDCVKANPEVTTEEPSVADSAAEVISSAEAEVEDKGTEETAHDTATELAENLQDANLAEAVQGQLLTDEEQLASDVFLHEDQITVAGTSSEVEKPGETFGSVSKEEESIATSESVSSPPNVDTPVETSTGLQSIAAQSVISPQGDSAAVTSKPQPATIAVTRSSRRRSSNQQSPEPPTKSKQAVGGQTREKRKSEESRSRGRRRSSELDPEDDDDDEAQSSGDESWNSEDDPDRLWCICKKPHNNRFMICCDVCEDWFHGKCVGVTKAMGQQMENKGLEWSCPNCSKKKDEDKQKEEKRQTKSPKEKEAKRILKDNKRDSVEVGSDTSVGGTQETQKEGTMEVSKAGENSSQQASPCEPRVMFCIVCKKEARQSSIYCSDACILKHAKDSLTVMPKEKTTTVARSAAEQQAGKSVDQGSSEQAANAGTTTLPKARPDARVIVFERKTGRLLAGPNAPTAANLKTWLKDNPTFQVVRPGILPPNKYYNAKTSVATSKSTAAQSKVTVTQQKIVSVQPSASSQPKPTTPQPKTVVAQQKSAAGAPNITTAQEKVVAAAPKSLPALQKPTPAPQKAIQSVVKSSAPVIISTKPVVLKVQKSPVPSGTGVREVQKVPVVAAKSPTLKSPVSASKPALKPPVNTNNVAKPVAATSPISKVPPVALVSKVPATSTVKESSVSKPPVEKVIVRKVELKRPSCEISKKEEEKEKEKPPGPEPIRLNVRKTLQELLQSRIQECPDLEVSESTVQKIALNIEEEMHAFFRDTGIKYKSKYRSLVFNIKDPKNLTLFRKIADKSVTPHQLVRLSPEELASQELAQWRAREAKHQLEMIKKNELDLLSLAKTYVLKTHKGEQVIETDESLKVEVPELVDPSAVPDLSSPPNNSVSSTVEDTELDKSKNKSKEKVKELRDKGNKDDKESRDRDKSKRDEKKKDRDKERTRKSDKESRREGHHESSRSDHERRRDKGKSSSRDKHRNSDKSRRVSEKHKDSKNGSSKKERKDEKDVKKADFLVKKEDFIKENKESNVEGAGKESNKVQVKEEVKSAEEVEAKPSIKLEPVEVKREPRDDSDLSDREPSSTVIIKTPDINTEEREQSICATVWKGFVNMPDVAKFFTTVQVVSGDPQNLCRDLPDTVDIVGRIIPDTVWDYISKMKKTGTKEILVIRLTAANDEEKIPYITLYTYLNTRNRLGVVGNVSKMIKDFYIMPLASHNPVPQVLLPLDGPGFEDYRPHLLLGILVRARRKRLAPENEYVAKMPKRPPPIPNPEAAERSYTPPLPSAGDVLGSLTPPHPPPSASNSYTPPHSPQHHFFPGPPLHPLIPVKNPDTRLKRMLPDDPMQETLIGSETQRILPVKLEKPPLVSQFSDDGDDDDDAPYSPGGSDDDIGESSEDNLLLTPKNPSDLQREVEELNRKIEEQKQQIQSISSAIVCSDTLGTVPVEPMKVKTIMQSYMLGASEERPPVLDEGDENEAYSPSRSFTPPPNTIPFIGPTEATPSVLSSLPPNISLPSNLHEILASIKKRESDTSAAMTAPSKGINLKADPIVQNYGTGSLEMDSTQVNTVGEDYVCTGSEPSYAQPMTDPTLCHSAASPAVTSATVLQSASSALLSLSTPVVHPLGTEVKPPRDPRQRGSLTPELMRPSGSTLSSLSDDDLIKKAAEMEMELTDTAVNSSGAEMAAGMVKTSLQQPLPPGVDSLPSLSGAAVPPPPPPLGTVKGGLVSISVPSGQPLPPGVEDEEYPSYGTSFAPPPPNSPATAGSHSRPMPPPRGPPVSFPVRHSTPAPYHVTHHYTTTSYGVAPPPPPPPCGTPQGASYTTYVSAAPVIYTAKKGVNEEVSNASGTKIKRKYQDCELDDSGAKRDRVDSPNSMNRESWDNKVPVPVRGRFGGRGRNFMRSSSGNQRGFMRPRANRSGSMHRPRWHHRDKGDNDVNNSHYDAGIRSEWDLHIKEFEEKHRERSRELRQRDRSRDRPSGHRSSHSSGRRSKSRDKDASSDSP